MYEYIDMVLFRFMSMYEYIDMVLFGFMSMYEYIDMVLFGFISMYEYNGKLWNYLICVESSESAVTSYLKFVFLPSSPWFGWRRSLIVQILFREGRNARPERTV